MKYIIDTNIWIYLFEGRQEVKELKEEIWRKAITPLLNPVVYTEVLGWQEIGNEEEKIRDYFTTLEMLPLEMRHWEQVILWRKKGIKKRLPDLLIGALSKKDNHPVMTRNINDFLRLGIEMENPWKE